MLYMFQWLYTYVARVYSKCFICCFRRKLQVCLFGCCICFTHMLQIFYLDVVYVCNGFQVFSRCFCKCFRCMLQVFQLFRTYVTSVSSVYCKSRSGVTHVTMRVKKRRGREWYPRAVWRHGPAWACETLAWARSCWRRHGVQTRAGDEVQTRASRCGHLSGRPGTGTTISTIPYHTIPYHTIT
jgi:hypothetical protein